MTCGVVRRSHGSFVFRRQGAVKDGPKGRRLWRSRSLTAPCRRKILIHALDGRASTESVRVRPKPAAPRPLDFEPKHGEPANRGTIIMIVCRLSTMPHHHDGARRGCGGRPIRRAFPGFSLTRSRFQRESASPARGGGFVGCHDDAAACATSSGRLGGEEAGFVHRAVEGRGLNPGVRSYLRGGASFSTPQIGRAHV